MKFGNIQRLSLLVSELVSPYYLEACITDDYASTVVLYDHKGE